MSREDLFAGNEDVASQLRNNLKESNVLDITSLSAATTAMFCFSKSTMFVSTMMMARNKQLAESFRGFLCRGQLLEGVDSDTIQHVVFRSPPHN